MGLVVVRGGRFLACDMLGEEEDRVEDGEVVEEEGGCHGFARIDAILGGDGRKEGGQEKGRVPVVIR